MQVDGNKNVIATSGGVAQQITNINVSIVDKEQFTKISEQLNQVLAAIGIKNEIGLEKKELKPDQQLIGEAVSRKIDEADRLFNRLVGTPETYLKLGNFGSVETL